MKRAATYLRVSRSDQSSRMQDDETKQLIRQRSWKFSKAYNDEGLSGASDKRPAFRAMLDAARRGDFDVLVVYRADRLFRSLRELVATLDELQELGVGFVSVHEPFDTTTSSGRLLVQLIGAFAEFERNVLRERTISGLAAARRRGARLGRPARSIDLTAVRQMRAKKWSWERIAKRLTVGRATLLRAVAAERATR